MPYEVLLALRYLRFHRGRTFLSVITLISVAGVIVGTAALVIALSLMAGFVEDVRERIYSGSAHLTVLSATHGDAFEGGAELALALEATPGVRVASPVLYTPALLSVEEFESHGFAELHGVDAGRHGRVTPRDWPEGDPFALLGEPTESGRDGIVLGEQLARRIAAVVGQRVRVMVPRLTLVPWGAAPRSGVFEVVGTYRSEHFQEDALRAYVSLEAARKLARAPGLSSFVEVRLADLRRIEPMKQRLRGELAADWLVVDLLEQNRDILRALRTEKLVLFLAIGLIVVVASLNIVSTLVLMVSDKTKEIGTLTAMGARPIEIARVFMVQGLIIGLAGTVLGLLLGVTLSWWLDRWEMVPLNPEVYYLDHVPFSTRPLDLVFVGTAAVLISFLATIYPAVKAAGLDPVEAIRHE